ncbi:MAG: homoserine kinase [Gammaproteobacteria bacterium]|nr:homoserine kinase [Gammaproteobacteria bacterium]MDH3534325.1 homoserine kinase [Gammaproteobacteria bacterium]
MSVFTTVDNATLQQFLKRYEIGSARAFSPIAAGITNTNYYLETEQGHFVLTLYEHHSDDELDYMLGLQRHLAAKSVLCPAPVGDRRGDLYSTLNQRPAAIIHRLRGSVQKIPRVEHCALIGAELSRFHLAGLDFPGNRPNPRGIDWLYAIGDMLDVELGREDKSLFSATLREYREFECASVAQGAIHADLFHDNALFVDGELGGIVDFDYACRDSFVFDIAVLLNDWCLGADARLDRDRVAAVLDAYQQQRPLSAAEIDALPLMLRIGALRFWLSRLYDRVFPQSGELTFIKDPDLFRGLLRQHSARAQELVQIFQPHYTG